MKRSNLFIEASYLIIFVHNKKKMSHIYFVVIEYFYAICIYTHTKPSKKSQKYNVVEHNISYENELNKAKNISILI